VDLYDVLPSENRHPWEIARAASIIGLVDEICPSLIRDLCITPPFARLLRQAQISILEILNVFMLLKLSPSLYLAKIGRSSKVSKRLANLGFQLPGLSICMISKKKFA